MKTMLHLVVLMISCSVSAQSYTLNWGSSFGSGWANGATTGTAYNIGGSGINCAVTITKSGGVFASSSGISAPTVAYSLVTVPGSANNLMVALDYSNPSQYTNITFTFTALVHNLVFYLADIDRLNNASNSYYDKITVTGSVGTSSIQPALTKYNTVDPNFLLIAGNVARVNTASGMAGNTASDASDQKGTIRVDFYGKSISSFTIRYDNHAGVAADPGLQFIGIGNIGFNQYWPLVVQLTSFEGANSNGKNLLKWKTVNESDMTYYAIERSQNGKDFTEIGRVSSRNETAASEYYFTDKTSSGNSIYRLKMVNTDGSFTYSKTVVVRSGDPEGIKVFPSVFTSSLNLSIQSQKEEVLRFALMDLSGKMVYHYAYKAAKGVNEFSMPMPSALARGQYFLVIENTGRSVSVMKQ